jgi:hypothetical protein
MFILAAVFLPKTGEKLRKKLATLTEVFGSKTAAKCYPECIAAICQNLFLEGQKFGKSRNSLINIFRKRSI